jgi:hypothetical protein
MPPYFGIVRRVPNSLDFVHKLLDFLELGWLLLVLELHYPIFDQSALPFQSATEVTQLIEKEDLTQIEAVSLFEVLVGVGEEVTVDDDFDGLLDGGVGGVGLEEFVKIHHAECFGQHLSAFVLLLGLFEGAV